jgi:group I intron endonuclease
VYGWNNIKHEVLSTNLTKKQAEREEVRLIALYDSTNQAKGYNQTNGGECEGKHTEEYKRNASMRMKEKIASGEATPPMLGKHFSKESRRKMSKSHKGKVLTEEHKQHIGDAFRGKFVGGKNPMARAVICIETGVTFDSVKEAADSIGVCRIAVNNCVRGLCRTSGGFHWEYVNQSVRVGGDVVVG